ncbi:hypothetical protein V6N12_028155 [Hibiscus sabdariffa]|uniref:Uncharacterized protein n=1 Tax=Hibiscus sabdariffa TaxID=183260 RepID=A0ABR2F4Z8_9ROSI
MGCRIFRSDLPLGLGSKTGRTTRAGVVTDLCFPCCFGCSLVVRIRVGSGVGEESQFLGVEKLMVEGESPGGESVGVSGIKVVVVWGRFGDGYLGNEREAGVGGRGYW